MLSRIPEDEHSDYSFPPCKDTFSSKIILAIAVFWLVMGVVFLIAPPFIPSIGMFVRNNAFWTCIITAVTCFILSAFFFVMYNIACDIHRTEHHLRELIYNSQISKNEILQQIRYVDDSVTRQGKVIIHQMNRQKQKEENRSSIGSTNAHDGAF